LHFSYRNFEVPSPIWHRPIGGRVQDALFDHQSYVSLPHPESQSSFCCDMFWFAIEYMLNRRKPNTIPYRLGHLHKTFYWPL